MSEGKIFDSVVDLVGGTPLLRLGALSPHDGAEICAKLEHLNPGGSVKDRPALAMIRAAEASGELTPGATIVEATSGNTGISLAMIASSIGYRCVIVMPEGMSAARQLILTSYGADVVLTPAQDGMAGAVRRAEAIASEVPGSFMPRQFSNRANPQSHERTTAEEIWRDTGGALDAIVIGVGTGGTLTGVARALRARQPELRVVAVEPRASAVLSGGRPGLHGIQGLGAGFIPDNVDRSLIDSVVTVTDRAAALMQRRLAHEEGLLVGISSGANVHAAVELGRRMPAGTRIVTVLCDDGERYLC